MKRLDTGAQTLISLTHVSQFYSATRLTFIPPFRGDVEGAQRMLGEIEKGTPLDRILGQGAAFTARAFGLSRVPAVLGQAVPAHHPRVCKPVRVTYATSPMGANHTAGIDYRDSLSREGQVAKSKNARIPDGRD